ncbi:MAG: hypothetical protein GY722_13930 [bacterium]|nr:hypothetical protein [bacterium]
MEHSTIADMAGWRSLAIQLALIAIGAFSFLILFSFGGQLIVAPALLPVEWLIAHNTDGWVSRAFSLLGALLLAEVILLGVGLLLGESVAAALVGGAAGLMGAVVFYRTSGRG